MDTTLPQLMLAQDDTESPIGPLVLEPPAGKPITLAPVPPADANSPQASSTQGAAIQQQAGVPVKQPPPAAVVPWAAAAVLAGAALIAWALVSRARAVRAAHAVRSANADSSTPEADLAEDMQELTDRLARELDTRAQRVERLIVTADERIARLEALEAQLEQTHRVARPPRVPTTPITEPKPVPLEAPVLAGLSGADPGLAAIYQLADQGVPVVQIAQRTGRPTGQVELVLNLRRAAMG